MIISAEQARAYSGVEGQQAFIELGFDSMGYTRTIADGVTGVTAVVLYSGLGLPIAYFRTADEAAGTALQSGMEIFSVH